MEQYKGDIYATLTAVSWSVAVVFFKLSGVHLGTVPLKVFQNIIAVVLFFVCIVVIGEPLFLDLDLSSWSLVIVSALIGITIGDTLFVAAINRIGASYQAIIDGLYMPFVTSLAFLFFGEVIPIGVVWGALLVLAAIFLAHLDGGVHKSIPRRDMIMGVTLAILAQLAMAICVVMVKDLLHKHSLLSLTAYRFLIGTVLLVLFYWWRGERKTLFAGFRPSSAWKVTITGAVLGPFAATLFWFAGFKYTLAGKAAVYNQLSTILIVILAAIFLRERLTPKRLIAIVLALCGGWIVLTS